MCFLADKLLISGYRIMVIILPCQGRDTGPIPVTRSKTKDTCILQVFFVTLKME